MITGKALFLLAAAAAPVSAQTSAPADVVLLPTGTQLPVSTPTRLPMKVGAAIHAQLLYPVYAENRLVLPAQTVVNGSVVALTPDRKRRNLARLQLDFTPYRTPVVRFDSVVLPGGATVPLATGTATDGAPIYRLVKPPPRKGGLVRRVYDGVIQGAKDRIAVVTGPDKGERFKEFLLGQLPYHPQGIAKGTAWTVATSEQSSLEMAAPHAPVLAAAAKASERATWMLEAYLDTPMSSETSSAGQAIRATVAEPILNPDGTVAVAQGSVLTGSVTAAKPARKFSRAGDLRFSFRELQQPGGQAQTVRVALRGADTTSEAQLAMDSEGNIKPKAQDKIIVPLILIALAAQPLDHDGERFHHGLGKDAVASNSLGLLGLIVGTAAQKPYLAAAIGYYGAALSIYQRIFAKGKPVAFPRYTRVELETNVTNATPITASPRP